MPNLRSVTITLVSAALLFVSRSAPASPVSYSRFLLPDPAGPCTLTMVGDRHAGRNEQAFNDLILTYVKGTAGKGVPTLLLAEIRPSESKSGFGTSLIPQLHNTVQADAKRAYAYLAGDPRPGGRHDWAMHIEKAAQALEILGEDGAGSAQVPTAAQREALLEVAGAAGEALAKWQKEGKHALPGVVPMAQALEHIDTFVQETLPKAIQDIGKRHGKAAAIEPLTALLAALEAQAQAMKNHWSTFLGADSPFAGASHLVALLGQTEALVRALAAAETPGACQPCQDQLTAAIAFAKGWDGLFNLFLEARFLTRILESTKEYRAIVVVAGNYHERQLAGHLKAMFGGGGLQNQATTLGCSIYSLGMGLDLDLAFTAAQLKALLFAPAKAQVSAGGESKAAGAAPGEARCGQCGASGTGKAAALKACGGCRKVRYCSPDCQKIHWRNRHKEECKTLR